MKKWPISILIAGALFLTACQTEQKANPTQKLEKVTLVLDYTPNTNHTGIYVAQAEGYFKEVGLDVSIIQPPENGAELMVASGRADFGVGYQDIMADSLANDLPITSIAAILTHNTSGLLSLADKNIQSPKDLEGKRYSTWDLPIEQAMVKKVVSLDGGDPDKVDMVASSATDILSALQTTIDVVWAYEGWDKVVADQAGVETKYMAFRDLDPVFDYYTPLIFTNQEMIDKKGETVQKMVTALAKGYTYSAKNPKQAADKLLQAVPELDKELVYQSQAFLSQYYLDDNNVWGKVDPKRWNGFYQWLNTNQLVERPLLDNAGFTNAFIAD